MTVSKNASDIPIREKLRLYSICGYGFHFVKNYYKEKILECSGMIRFFFSFFLNKE